MDNFKSQSIITNIPEVYNKIPLELVLNYNYQENIDIPESQAKEKAIIFLEKLIEINNHSADPGVLIVPPMLQFAKNVNTVSGNQIVDTELVQCLDNSFNVEIDEISKSQILENAQEVLQTQNLVPLNWQESVDKLNEIMLNHSSLSNEFRGVEIMSRLLSNAERTDVVGVLEMTNTIISNKCSILLAVYGLYFIQDQIHFESNLGQLIRILNFNIKLKIKVLKSTLLAKEGVAGILSELVESVNLIEKTIKISPENQSLLKRKPVLMMLGMGALGFLTVGTSIVFGDKLLLSVAAPVVAGIEPPILTSFAKEIFKIGVLSYNSMR